MTEERIDRVVRRTSIRKKQALTGPDSCGRVRQSMIQPINTARQPRLNLRFGGYGMRKHRDPRRAHGQQSPAYAQMGSVVGSVMDESGGVVPGASVALTAQTGGQKTTTTSQTGLYRFGAVPAGRVPAFRRVVRVRAGDSH